MDTQTPLGNIPKSGIAGIEDRLCLVESRYCQMVFQNGLLSFKDVLKFGDNLKLSR